MNGPDDETPLPAVLPHHEADPTSQRERVLADDDAVEIDPDDLLATRPVQKIELIESEPSDLFARPPDPGAADDFDDEERTPPPRFLQQPGSDHDATLPRERHLVDDDADDDADDDDR